MNSNCLCWELTSLGAGRKLIEVLSRYFENVSGQLRAGSEVGGAHWLIQVLEGVEVAAADNSGYPWEGTA